jgi:hypothetical protein
MSPSRWTSASILAAFLAASCADPATTSSGNGRATETDSAVSTASPAPSPEPFRAFVPPTRTEGEVVVLPVVFPDGTTAKLVYPPDLDLAGLGVRPYWAGCGRDFGFHYYDPYGTVYGGDPIQTWTRSDGQTVSLWNSVDKEPGVDNQPLVYLIFRFGEWTVDVYDYGGKAALSEDQRAACAKGLSGSVTDDGWIVISGSPEIDLGGAEPELEFGGLGAKPFVLFFSGPCKPESDANEELPSIDGVPVSRAKGFASWCHRGEMMRIHVYFSGKTTFVERLIRDLEIRDVHLAS